MTLLPSFPNDSTAIIIGASGGIGAAFVAHIVEGFIDG